jgi:hypothetical protein
MKIDGEKHRIEGKHDGIRPGFGVGTKGIGFGVCSVQIQLDYPHRDLKVAGKQNNIDDGIQVTPVAVVHQEIRHNGVGENHNELADIEEIGDIDALYPEIVYLPEHLRILPEHEKPVAEDGQQNEKKNKQVPVKIKVPFEEKEKPEQQDHGKLDYFYSHDLDIRINKRRKKDDDKQENVF